MHTPTVQALNTTGYTLCEAALTSCTVPFEEIRTLPVSWSETADEACSEAIAVNYYLRWSTWRESSTDLLSRKLENCGVEPSSCR